MRESRHIWASTCTPIFPHLPARPRAITCCSTHAGDDLLSYTRGRSLLVAAERPDLPDGSLCSTLDGLPDRAEPAGCARSSLRALVLGRGVLRALVLGRGGLGRLGELFGLLRSDVSFRRLGNHHNAVRLPRLDLGLVLAGRLHDRHLGLLRGGGSGGTDPHPGLDLDDLALVAEFGRHGGRHPVEVGHSGAAAQRLEVLCCLTGLQLALLVLLVLLVLLRIVAHRAQRQERPSRGTAAACRHTELMQGRPTHAAADEPKVSARVRRSVGRTRGRAGLDRRHRQRALHPCLCHHPCFGCVGTSSRVRRSSGCSGFSGARSRCVSEGLRSGVASDALGEAS
ncbi:hypothetical protein T484DRAFT_1969507 [Baffinella frigidus]|nr:hypothetical protein T484DRAFT_1969507 [Cryptophyta sp. CCMP2293]